jgi:hypothetical protein
VAEDFAYAEGCGDVSFFEDSVQSFSAVV